MNTIKNSFLVAAVAGTLGMAFGPSMVQASVITLGTPDAPGSFNFSYNPYTQGSGAYQYTDAVNNGVEYHNESPSYLDAYLQPSVAGTPGVITWEFQAAAGTAFSSDISVVSNFCSFGTPAGSYQTADYSTNGSNFTQFDGITASDVGAQDVTDSLNTYGYTGSSTLYLQYTLYVAGTTSSANWEQLFRVASGTSEAPFQVNGSTVAVPEPATLGLVGVGVMGLLLIGRKRKIV